MKSLKRVEGINVVPLIDIMLVLLAIVLTISSFIALGKLELTLPNGTSQIKMQPKTFEISITADKKFYINQIEIEKKDILEKLQILTKEDSVAISADKLVPYEEFIFVIDLLKRQGVEKIGMVVQK